MVFYTLYPINIYIAVAPVCVIVICALTTWDGRGNFANVLVSVIYHILFIFVASVGFLYDKRGIFIVAFSTLIYIFAGYKRERSI